MQYWIPGGAFGYGGSTESYSNGYDFRPGFFVGSQRGKLGLSGFTQSGPASNFSALTYDSTQFGYNMKTAGGSPVRIAWANASSSFFRGSAGQLLTARVW